MTARSVEDLDRTLTILTNANRGDADPRTTARIDHLLEIRLQVTTTQEDPR